ncbi:hypothetical protein DVH24_018562 [Malus domestica]|uniref:Serine-threonine/tyrosine-protein kinase catalytic domain-containing protein n=1 Tax=Malus domestica TaxID=3750 RepID=A0A498HP77_MALDO|nr:hypothetical protein DVH24_018562 [Malus domestica]
MSSYSTPELSDSSSNDGVGVAIVVVLVVVLVKIVIAVVVCKKCQKLARERSQNVSLVQIVTPDHRTLTMEKIRRKIKERAERTVNVAMWCVKYKQEDRPSMSVVVKMLEGAVEIPRPSTNPFQHLMSDTPYPAAPVYDTSNPTTSTSSDFCSVPSQTVNGYRAVDDFPIMKKYEIEIAYKGDDGIHPVL